MRGLDLRHPPCESLVANRMFYASGALAYNLMKAVELLRLSDGCQGWTVATLLRPMLRLPAMLVSHARRRPEPASTARGRSDPRQVSG